MTVQQSTASVFYETLVQQYQNKELVDLAKMDQIYSRKGSSKKDQGMADAVDNAECVRNWTEQMMSLQELEKELDTTYKKSQEDDDPYGLTESAIKDK